MSAQGVDPGLAARLRYVLDPPHCRVYRATDQVIGTGAVATIAFSAARWKVGDTWASAASTRLVAPVSGLYTVKATVQWAASALGARRQLRLQANGATVVGIVEQPPPASGGFCFQTVAAEYELAAGEYVEVQVFQDTGGNLNVVAAGNFSPEATFRRVADRA